MKKIIWPLLLVLIPLVAEAQINNTTGTTNVNCVQGCSAGTTVTDNGTVVAGQSSGLGIALNYIYDPVGTVWSRIQFGQTLMVSSIPVVIASNQSAIPVSQSGAWSFTFGSPQHVIIDSGALAALTDKSQFSRVTDGTRDGTVKAASTLPLLTDTALVTTQRDPIPAGTNEVGGVNVTKVAGTAVSVNSGVKDAGTVRVVLATDQPALTNKLLVTPDSVALPANQSVNVAQMAGTTTATNSGLKDAGTVRVVIATDQPALTNKILVTPDSVPLPANQSVNVTQFGGTNVSVGTGAAGNGVPRVTPSNDQFDGTNILSLTGQESVAAPVAATWYIRKQWAVPALRHYRPSNAWATVTTALTRTMAGVINNLGNLNLSTNTFTAANSVAAPFSYSRLFGCVTTVMSATVDTVTPTYTNDAGVSAASAGVVFAASTPVGSCFEFILNQPAGSSIQEGGVRAVTAAVDTAAPTGVVTFYGVTSIADFAGTSANQTETMTIQNFGELNPNEQVAIFMWQTLTNAQLKTFGLSGTLR